MRYQQECIKDIIFIPYIGVTILGGINKIAPEKLLQTSAPLYRLKPTCQEKGYVQVVSTPHIL